MYGGNFFSLAALGFDPLFVSECLKYSSVVLFFFSLFSLFLP